MQSIRESLALPKRGVVSFVGGGGKTTLMFALAGEIVENGGRVLTTTTTKILRPSREQTGTIVIEGDSERAIDRFRELSSFSHITAAMGQDPRPAGKLLGFTEESLEEIQRSGVFDWILVEADGARQKPMKAPAPHEPVVPAFTDYVIGVLGLDVVGAPLTREFVFRPERVSKLTGLEQGGIVDEETVAKLFCLTEGIFGNSAPLAMKFAFLNKSDLPNAVAAGKRICELLKLKGAPLEGAMVGSARARPPVWHMTAGY